MFNFVNTCSVFIEVAGQMIWVLQLLSTVFYLYPIHSYSSTCEENYQQPQNGAVGQNDQTSTVSSKIFWSWRNKLQQYVLMCRLILFIAVHLFLHTLYCHTKWLKWFSCHTKPLKWFGYVTGLYISKHFET